MALNIVDLPQEYIPDFNKGRPLFDAQIFVGIPDLDPEILANRKTVTLRQESGDTVDVAQPIRTSSGGVPTYNGSPAQILVDGNYSIKVLDRFGAQEYYYADYFKGTPILDGEDSRINHGLISGLNPGDGSAHNANDIKFTGGKLVEDLSVSSDVTKGAALVGYRNRTSFQKMKDTRDLRDFGGAVGATAETNGDALDAMKAEAIAGDLEMNIKGVYTFDRKLLMNTQGLTLRGSSGWGTQMVLDAGSTDDSMIDVTARLCQVDDMMLLSQNRIGLYLRAAQLFKSDGLITKGNATGIYHEEGNSAQITKFFAESDVNGYVAEAVGEGNINGCYIQGRAINCQIGWNIKDNKAPTGPGNAFMHNMLRWTAESNTVAGIKDQSTGNKCRYNYGFLYSESNSGINFDINKENPNWWAISNPDNDNFMTSGLVQGVYTSGNNISPINAQSIGKVSTTVFSASGSLGGTGTSIYTITNTSGGTLTLTLSFAAYMPIGSERVIYKLDNTPGFTIAPVAGISFVGDTGVTFGAFVNNQVEQMSVTKLTATTVLLQITPKGA